MKVTRIEIDNGGVSVENYSSSRATVRINDASVGEKPRQDVVFEITDDLARDLVVALEVYLRALED